MVELIKIRKYLSEFHDGALLGIEHTDRDCVFTLESAEMNSSEMKDAIPLSDQGCIKGKLHMEKVQSITISDKPFSGLLKIPYDYGEIFHFEIRNDIVELQVSWRNLPKNPAVNDFSTIVIQADSIWWENRPDLIDPF